MAAKVEPKVYFANERTFLSWMHMSVTLGAIGGAMLGLAPSPSDEVVHSGSTAETVGRVMMANAVVFALYALALFYWRSHKISAGHAGSFDDRVGPAVLCVALLGGFIMTLMVHEGTAAAPPPRPCSTIADQASPRCCRAELLIVRHAEKISDASVGLSADGQNRAEYLARCLQHRSAARCLGGGVQSLLAPMIRHGKSERSVDTLQPAATALHRTIDQSVDKADHKAFAALIQRSGTMACNASTVVAWQHDQIPGLVTELWRGLTEPHENDAFKAWPMSCASASWPEPPGSADRGNGCYDQVWRVGLVGLGGALADGKAKPWFPAGISRWQEGFGGLPNSPCAQGLTAL